MVEEIDEFAMFRARALGAESEYLLLQQASRQQRSSPRPDPQQPGDDESGGAGGRSSVRRRHVSGSRPASGRQLVQDESAESTRENGGGMLLDGGEPFDAAGAADAAGSRRRNRLGLERRADSSGSKMLLSPGTGSFEDDDHGQPRGLQRTHSCRSTSKRSSQHQLAPGDLPQQPQHPGFSDAQQSAGSASGSGAAHHKFNRNRTMTMPVRRRTASSSRSSPRPDALAPEPSPSARRRVVDAAEPEAEIAGDVAVYRVRNFTTKAGSVINRGDSIKIRNRGGGGSAGGGGSGRGGKASPGHENGYGSTANVRNRPAVRRSSSSDSHPSSPGSRGPPTARDRREALSRHSSRGRSSQDDDRSASPSVVGTMLLLPPDNDVGGGATGCGGALTAEQEDEEEEEEPIRQNGDRLSARVDVIKRQMPEEEIEPPVVYKVLVLGSGGVGKTTLVQQLMTSEYLANKDNYMDDDVTDKIVSVQVDDEESMIQFIDIPGAQANKSRDLVDANLVVYSVTDRVSFQYAQSCLQELRPAKRHNVVILVANKQDIVRNRVISEEDGKNLAARRHCKFIEVSALLDHRMDELLVGITRQIRLRKGRPRGGPNAADPSATAGHRQRRTSSDAGPELPVGCLQRAAVAAFRRLFRRRGPVEATSCDDLFTP